MSEILRDRIEVFVNGRSILLYRGTQVKHALIAFDQKIYEATRQGRVLVTDENGFVVGLEGGLTDGVRLFVE